MYIAFNNIGLILIGDWDKTTPSFSLFFQFQGLVNDKGLQYADISEADDFVSICWMFRNVLLPFLMIFNGLALFYFYYVIITFRSVGCCKFMIVAIMFIQWILFTSLSALYYWTFHVFWTKYLKDNRE